MSSGPMRLSARRAYAVLVGVVLIFGLTFPIAKIGLAYLTPLWFACLRTAIGAVTIFLFLLATGHLRRPRRRDLPMMITGGVVQVGGFLGLSTLGLYYVEAGRSAILSFTITLWITPLAVLFLGERLTALRAAGLVTGLAGVVVLFNPLAFDWTDPHVVFGNFALLLAALCWGLTTLHARVHRWELSPLQLTPWQLVCATGALALMAALFEGRPAPVPSWELLWTSLFIGAFGAGFGFCGTMIVARALPSITLSISYLASPIVGIIASSLILGEAITWPLALGVVLILGGVALVSVSDARASRAPAGAL